MIIVALEIGGCRSNDRLDTHHYIPVHMDLEILLRYLRCVSRNMQNITWNIFVFNVLKLKDSVSPYVLGNGFDKTSRIQTYSF